jgi:HAD superfamily hydrolase (TIGR01509 family)
MTFSSLFLYSGDGAMTELCGVFWDVDGTLAETELDGHRPAYNAAFAELGLPFQWDRSLYQRLLAVAGGMRRVKVHAESLGIVLDDDQLRRVRDRKRVHYIRRVLAGEVPWRPGVLRLLHQIDRAGISQWIVTSSGRASVDALLQAGADHLPSFEGVISADDVSEGKPAPDGYQLALSRSGLHASTVLAIEDSAAGLKAATTAGLRCLLTPSPWDGELAALKQTAAAVVDHLGDPGHPVTCLLGPPCSETQVTLEYLRSLLSPHTR